MPDRDSRRYREIKQQLIDAENHLLHLDRGGQQDGFASYPEARDAYLVARQTLSQFLERLREDGKEICPNYDRVVRIIEDAKNRHCEVHPDQRCGGLTRRSGSCIGQLEIVQRARRGPSYTPGTG